MIEMTQIQDDLSPYCNGVTVLWGEGDIFKNMNALLIRNKIKISLLYSFDFNVGDKLEATDIYSNTYPSATDVTPFLVLPEINFQIFQEKLEELMITYPEKIVIQLAFLDEMKETEAINSLRCKNVTVIPTMEAWSILHFMEELDAKEQQPILDSEKETIRELTLRREALTLQHFADQHLEKPLLILCMPPKTGDHSLSQTFHHHNISHYFVFHSPEVIDILDLLQEHPKIKIITAVRDPIAENISLLYQIIAEFHHSLTAKYLLWGTFNRDFFKNGGDVQCFFDIFLHNINDKNKCVTHPIQRFMPVFKSQIVDITQYPFSKEKGFSLIKKGNLEVFTFQIEKLDELSEEISKFVGISIPSFKRANVATEKWVGQSYRKAQRELTFSKEYFNACFQEPWVKHCYGEKDIEFMKKRWEMQISNKTQIYLK